MTPEINKVHNSDCLEYMRKLDDSCVDITVTSPPYNLGIEYDNHCDNMKYTDYISWLSDIFSQLYRITKIHGRMCVNVPLDTTDGNGGRNPLYADIIRIVPMSYRCTIFWDNGNIPSRTAWGSFCSCSAPNILLPGEAIIVFYKGEWKKPNVVSKIDKHDFVNFTNGVWKFQPEMNREHPAPFPIELPQRCLKMFADTTDVVFDPFIGSGTTGMAAESLGMKWFGVDKSSKYVDIAQRRIKLEQSQQKLF